MPEYEAAIREVFPTLYEAALRLCGSEEEAAWLAQLAFVRAYLDVESFR
jgi:DNA-directed RNA polymerase specialized sigma24 family protein